MEKIQILGDFEIAQQELRNDKNNAVSEVYDFKKQGSGILDNAIFTIKDVYATKEGKTKSSSLILDNFQPGYNATVVQKLFDQGAIAVGKVYNDELALGGTGLYSAYGIIKNPLNHLYLVGGSSSGSAATFTSNISFALGSDTGDSVRLPASYNGIFGFKPSYGAISRYGMFAYASSLDTVAYFAHNVNDLFMVSKATFGKDFKDMTSVDVPLGAIEARKPKTILALDFSEFCVLEVNQAFNQVIEKFKSEGVQVDVIKPNLDILRCIKPVYQVVSFSEASSNLANLNGIAFGERVQGQNWEEIMTRTRSEKFGKMVSERLALGSYFLHSENQEELFIKAQKVRRVIKDYLNSLHESADLVIFPSFASKAPKIGEDVSYDVMDYILTGANLAGNPSLSMPLGFKDQMPFNLELEAGIYQDSKLLQYALWVESILGGK
ncbi:amidase family protein [Mycoplasmopsis sturni]|uniref:amidase family protein n=1 Tax=Mycoplasmopsis sturni TaxID=39047 RepID=UPI000568B149|nr:amidase family protein [Mycoplasmopsis sturni]